MKYASEGGHSVCCDKARILEIENDSRYGKYSYKESTRSANRVGNSESVCSGIFFIAI
jgi:hypothetical protein